MLVTPIVLNSHQHDTSLRGSRPVLKISCSIQGQVLMRHNFLACGAEHLQTLLIQQCWLTYASPSTDTLIPCNEWRQWLEEYDVMPTAILEARGYSR